MFNTLKCYNWVAITAGDDELEIENTQWVIILYYSAFQLIDKTANLILSKFAILIFSQFFDIFRRWNWVLMPPSLVNLKRATSNGKTNIRIIFDQVVQYCAGAIGLIFKIDSGVRTLPISAHEMAPVRAFSILQKWPKTAKMTPNDLLTLKIVFTEPQKINR